MEVREHPGRWLGGSLGWGRQGQGLLRCVPRDGMMNDSHVAVKDTGLTSALPSSCSSHRRLDLALP